MQIIEDITYSITDVINQIQEVYGFTYVEVNDHTGYVVLDNKTTLNIEFNEEEKKMDSAIIELSDNIIDITDSLTTADVYMSSIESATQIVSLIHRMLGNKSEDDQNENN